MHDSRFLSFPSVNESNVRTHLHPVSGTILTLTVAHNKVSGFEETTDHVTESVMNFRSKAGHTGG